MPRNTTPIKPASDIALQAEERLRRALVRIGSDDVHYVRAFRTNRHRQIALNRVNQGIHVWSEPVWEHASPSIQALRKRRYSPSCTRDSNLEANAPLLWTGHAADYWRFPTLGDLEAFVAWYKTL